MLEISSPLTMRKWCHQSFKPQALIMMTGTLTCHQMFVIVEVFWPAIEQLFYFVVVTVASKLSLWSKGVDGFLLLFFSNGLDLVLGNWLFLMRFDEGTWGLFKSNVYHPAFDSFNVRPGGLLFQECFFSKPQSKTSNFSLVISLFHCMSPNDCTDWEGCIEKKENVLSNVFTKRLDWK